MVNFNEGSIPTTDILRKAELELQNIEKNKDIKSQNLGKYILIYQKSAPLTERNKEEGFKKSFEDFAQRLENVSEAKGRIDADTEVKGYLETLPKVQREAKKGLGSTEGAVAEETAVSKEVDPIEEKQIALENIANSLSFIENDELRTEVNETLKNFISPLDFSNEAIIEQTTKGFSVTIPCENAKRGEIRPTSKIAFDPCLVPNEKGMITFEISLEGDEVVLDLNEHFQMRGLEGRRLDEVIANVTSKLPNIWPANYATTAKAGLEKAVKYPTYYQNFRFRAGNKGNIEVKAKIKEAVGPEKDLRKEQRNQLGALTLGLLTKVSPSSASLVRLALFEDDDKVWAEANLINRLFRTQQSDQDKDARVVEWKTHS